MYVRVSTDAERREINKQKDESDGKGVRREMDVKVEPRNAIRWEQQGINKGAAGRSHA
jgi:hypothetical protein